MWRYINGTSWVSEQMWKFLSRIQAVMLKVINLFLEGIPRELTHSMVSRRIGKPAKQRDYDIYEEEFEWKNLSPIGCPKG